MIRALPTANAVYDILVYVIPYIGQLLGRIQYLRPLFYLILFFYIFYLLKRYVFRIRTRKYI